MLVRVRGRWEFLALEPYNGVVTIEQQPVTLDFQRLAREVGDLVCALHPGCRKIDIGTIGRPAALRTFGNRAIVELVLELAVGFEFERGSDLHLIGNIKTRDWLRVRGGQQQSSKDHSHPLSRKRVAKAQCMATPRGRTASSTIMPGL